MSTAALYQAFFGLQAEPFSIAPDPRFLYMSQRHQEALAHLLYGLQSGGGFVVLTGAVGAGKTTVSRAFLERLPQNCRVAYVLNPRQTSEELLATIGQELGLSDPTSRGPHAWVQALYEHLLAAHAQGLQHLLIIDEAQNLSADVLEQLRLLTNLETAQRKLLQIILIGQPELRALLAQPHLEQLSQRIIARYHLEPLNLADVQRYVEHRLAVAGRAAPLPFDQAALRWLHRLSGGVPRRINLLCDRALLGAWSAGRGVVSGAIVRQAAQEVWGEAVPGSWTAHSAGYPTSLRWRWMGGGVVIGVVVGMLLSLIMGWALDVAGFISPWPVLSFDGGVRR